MTDEARLRILLERPAESIPLLRPSRPDRWNALSTPVREKSCRDGDASFIACGCGRGHYRRQTEDSFLQASMDEWLGDVL